MPRTMTGKVVSTATDKTAVVNVEHKRSHKLYHKQYTVSKNYKVHDEKNEVKVGDKVEIVEGRPMSKTKRFSLVSVVEKAKE